MSNYATILCSPIYSLMLRLVKHLQEARRELANHPDLGGLERAVYAIIRHGDYPVDQDMDGVALSLARVQFTYRLDPLDMAKGLCNYYNH